MEHLGRGQLAPKLFDLGADDRIGRCLHRRLEDLHPRAIVDIAQPLCRIDRFDHQFVVGFGQQPGETSQLFQAMRQAGHAQIEQFLGLLAAQPGGLAGVGLHRRPPLGVIVQDAVDPADRVLGIGLLGGEEGRRDNALLILIPDAGQLAAGTQAHL